MIIDSASYTCPGGHEINEDSFLCRSDKGIFIVADGLGGHADGEVASKAAVDYFERNCQGGYTDERISALLEGANTQVLQYGEGGKTTTAIALIENGRFVYANVGDSRVYLFRDGKVFAQTKDHSVCQASVDMGMMRPEDIRGSEDRSRLLKVLGGEETLALKKHYQPIQLRQGDAFLICSDGFWDYVYEPEMEADLLKSDSADVWLKYMLKRHILRAQNKGDNYTAICGIVHMEPGDNFPTDNFAAEAIAPTVAFQDSVPVEKPFPVKAVIIGVVAAVLVIAAVILAVFLLNTGDGGSEPDPDTSSTPVETPNESVPPDDNPPASPNDPAVNPDDSAVDPDDPAANPDDPAANPDDPAVDPNDPAVNPDDPAVNPDDPDVDPDDPDVDPDDPAVNPDDPAVDPDNDNSGNGDGAGPVIPDGFSNLGDNQND